MDVVRHRRNTGSSTSSASCFNDTHRSSRINGVRKCSCERYISPSSCPQPAHLSDQAICTIAYMAPAPDLDTSRRNLALELAPYLVGALLNWGLLGCLSVQVYLYTLSNGSDKWGLKTLGARFFLRGDTNS
ncbi:hypothetical protein PLICRDRAFT_338626 [Plicaturopsis crispa FD-325 SS-3]|uniref:Uncharacterized protein n=1 Tax=Plicaturopsis crispa FD-325 SS-3 TaxID=944288 RepID=A0A0C9SLD5_PLICR|nr:hypothetical protein PLICRDRAFT_338626 [Plicaturopsis crispa FD-325 SS-3]